MRTLCSHAFIMLLYRSFTGRRYHNIISCLKACYMQFMEAWKRFIIALYPAGIPAKKHKRVLSHFSAVLTRFMFSWYILPFTYISRFTRLLLTLYGYISMKADIIPAEIKAGIMPAGLPGIPAGLPADPLFCLSCFHCFQDRQKYSFMHE